MISLLYNFPIYTSQSRILNFILIIGLLFTILMNAYRYLSILGKDNNYNSDDNKIPMGNQLSNIVFLVVIFYRILSSDITGFLVRILYYSLVVVFAVQSYMLVVGIFLQLTKFNYKYLYSKYNKKEYKDVMMNIRITRSSALILLCVSVILTRLSLIVYFSFSDIFYILLLIIILLVLNISNRRYTRVYKELIGKFKEYYKDEGNNSKVEHE